MTHSWYSQAFEEVTTVWTTDDLSLMGLVGTNVWKNELEYNNFVHENVVYSSVWKMAFAVGIIMFKHLYYHNVMAAILFDAEIIIWHDIVLIWLYTWTDEEVSD